jgi:hypothetical protein
MIHCLEEAVEHGVGGLESEAREFRMKVVQTGGNADAESSGISRGFEIAASVADVCDAFCWGLSFCDDFGDEARGGFSVNGGGVWGFGSGTNSEKWRRAEAQ